MAKVKKVHHAWFVMIGVAFMIGCCGGAFLNSSGVFFNYVVSDLGISLGQLTLYLTFYFVFTTLIMPLVGRVLPACNIRIVLSICVVAVCIAAGAMSLYSEPWQWWISGALFGLFGGFVFIVPGPILIENWFYKKKGFAMGLAMCASGLGGAIFSPVCTALIEVFGWRQAYVLTAIIVAVCTLPWTMFVFRFKPADMGLLPYGWDENASVQSAANQPGVPKKVALRTLAFWALFVFCGIEALFSGYNGHLPGFAVSIDLGAAFGASMLTASMLGYVIATVGVGPLMDKYGPYKPTGVVIGVAVLSLLGFAFIRDPFWLMVCAFVFGTNSIMVAVSLPMLLADVFGNKDYAGIMAYARMCGIIGSVGSTAIGFSFDYLHTFVPAFLGGIVVLAVCALMLVITFKQRAKVRKLWVE